MPRSLRLTAEINQFYAVSRCSRFSSHLKDSQGFNKGRKFGMSKVSHVKIREAFCKLIAQFAGKDPSVVIGAAFCNAAYFLLKLLQAQSIS